MLKGRKLVIQIFDKQVQRISELLANKGMLSRSSNNKVRKIRVRYDQVDYSTRKQIIEYLKELGFRQVGNTTSWILDASSTKNIA